MDDADVGTIARSMRLQGASDLTLLEALFEPFSSSPFFVKDRDACYVSANPAMARLCGVRQPRDLYGHRAERFFPRDLALRYEALDRQVMANGIAVKNQLELSAGNGATPIWLLFSRVPVRAADGAILGVAAVARQLTDSQNAHPVYRRVAGVMECMRREFDRPLRLDALAGRSGVSKAQIERDFLKLLGVTPGAFLQQLRMERALSLLQGDGTIAAVAYECGYSDHSAFSRSFRRTMGMSPQMYRERLGPETSRGGVSSSRVSDGLDPSGSLHELQSGIVERAVDESELKISRK